MAKNSPEEMAKTMIANLPDKTGKSLSQWMSILKKKKPAKHGEAVKFLKTEHGVTHGFANLIAHEFLANGRALTKESDQIDAQYSGPKSHLRPIYDAIAKIASAFGTDVEVAPKKTYVSLRRNKQFALIQPSTKDRVDLGINLKGHDAEGRLEKSGSFNAMVSHRVRLSKKGDVNAELKSWLRKAYDAA